MHSQWSSDDEDGPVLDAVTIHFCARPYTVTAPHSTLTRMYLRSPHRIAIHPHTRGTACGTMRRPHFQERTCGGPCPRCGHCTFWRVTTYGNRTLFWGVITYGNRTLIYILHTAVLSQWTIASACVCCTTTCQLVCRQLIILMRSVILQRVRW